VTKYVEVRCNLSLNTKCPCGEGGRERGWGCQEPDWQIDRKEGGVVHGGGGGGKGEKERVA